MEGGAPWIHRSPLPPSCSPLHFCIFSMDHDQRCTQILRRSLSDSQIGVHEPPESVTIESLSHSEGAAGSKLWILLSHSPPPSCSFALAYHSNVVPLAVDGLRHELAMVTLPELTVDEDTPLSIVLSIASFSTSFPFLYKCRRGPSESTLLHFASTSDALCLLQPLAGQISSVDEGGNNCLHVSSRAGQSYALKQLLSVLSSVPEAERRACVNARNSDGETPLHLAVKSNDADSVHYLVSAHAHLTLVDTHDNTVLHYLADSHNDAIYKEILERKLEPEQMEMRNREGLSPLHLAVRKLRLSLIEGLVDAAPTSIHHKDSQGRSPLLHAIEMNDDEIVAFLLSKGADPNVEDDNGVNPLLLSNTVGNMVIMGQLLDAGADAALKTKTGHSLCAVDEQDVQRIIGGHRIKPVVSGQRTGGGIENRRPPLFGSSRGEDVSSLDYLTRLRLSKLMDVDSKWEGLAGELQCEHMVELIGICSTDSSPTMILLDQYEQLPNASITQVMEALERMGLTEAHQLLLNRPLF